MARATSKMMTLGAAAPAFTLLDPDGNSFSLESVTGNSATLIMFICNHCPYVKHVREELARIANDYSDRGIGIFGINSNDAESYPGDSPEKMKEESATWGYLFLYLIDADQSVADAYRAACTPDFFLFDENLKLVYRGQLDGSRPANEVPVDGSDMRAALDALLAGESVTTEHIPSIGCSIKWKPGNTPSWFG